MGNRVRYADLGRQLFLEDFRRTGNYWVKTGVLFPRYTVTSGPFSDSIEFSAEDLHGIDTRLPHLVAYLCSGRAVLDPSFTFAATVAYFNTVFGTPLPTEAASISQQKGSACYIEKLTWVDVLSSPSGHANCEGRYLRVSPYKGLNIITGTAKLDATLSFDWLEKEYPGATKTLDVGFTMGVDPAQLAEMVSKGVPDDRSSALPLFTEDFTL